MVNRTKQTGKKQERKRENERTTDWSSDTQNQKEGCMDGRYVLKCVRVYLFVCVCVQWQVKSMYSKVPTLKVFRAVGCTLLKKYFWLMLHEVVSKFLPVSVEYIGKSCQQWKRLFTCQQEASKNFIIFLFYTTEQCRALCFLIFTTFPIIFFYQVKIKPLFILSTFHFHQFCFVWVHL